MVVGVVAYKRTESLLSSLKLLTAANEISEIHVGLDYSEIQEKIQEKIQNLSDPKSKINVHATKSKLGLKKNVYRLCDLLSKNFEDFVIIEDDVNIELQFVDYIKEANKLNLEKIRQILLYTLDWDEFNRKPLIHPCFLNTLFLSKIPGSIAVYYKKDWWQEFKAIRDELDIEFVNLNPVANNWGKQSWKKVFFKFLVKHNYYSLIPKGSYAHHVGNHGTNFKNKFVIGFDTPLSKEEMIEGKQLTYYSPELLFLDKNHKWKGLYANTVNYSSSTKLLFNYPLIKLLKTTIKKIISKL